MTYTVILPTRRSHRKRRARTLVRLTPISSRFENRRALKQPAHRPNVARRIGRHNAPHERHTAFSAGMSDPAAHRPEAKVSLRSDCPRGLNRQQSSNRAQRPVRASSWSRHPDFESRREGCGGVGRRIKRAAKAGKRAVKQYRWTWRRGADPRDGRARSQGEVAPTNTEVARP